MDSQRLAGWRGWCLAIAALPAAAYGASAPLIHHTFEDGVSGWTGIGVNSKAAVTREAGHVKEGKAALQFDYTVEKGEMGALRLAPDPAFAKAKSLRFWVHADAPTTLAVVLHEKQGGRYSAVIAAPYMTGSQRVLGAIGVIGPARLNYARIIPLVDYTARVLGQVMNA